MTISRTLIAAFTGLCVGYITYLVWSKAHSSFEAKRQRKLEDDFGAQHGCLPVKASFPAMARWPFQIDQILEIISNFRAGKIMHYSTGNWKKLECTTLEDGLLGHVALATLEPANVKAMYTRSAIYNDGQFDFDTGTTRDPLKEHIGDAVFTQEGPRWKYSRDVVRRHFAKTRFDNMHKITRHASALVEQLSNSSENIVNLKSFFLQYTMDTTTDLLFGFSEGANHFGNYSEFAESFDFTSASVGTMLQFGPFYRFYRNKELPGHIERARAYVLSCIKAASNATDDGDASTFCKYLMEDFKDSIQVRDQLLNLLFAGRETTACLLLWTLYTLTQNPPALSKLKQEVNDMLQGKTDIDKHDIQKLPYLRCVINETLRLFPPVPNNVRVARRPTVFPVGGGADGKSPLLVRKDQFIGASNYHMGRRPDIYGEDANTFRPERWEDGKLIHEVTWAFLPFGAGPRNCLGQELALLETSCAVIRMLQTFPDLRLPHDEKPTPLGEELHRISILLNPRDGCRVQLRP